MTYGSLFTGIGGLDLGLDRSGFTCKWMVENDPYAIKVLNRHWPDVKRYGDITTVRGDELETVDLICGGFPCQDLSQAGKRIGIEGSRSGLWFEYARIIGVVGPRYVLIENVPGLLVPGAMPRVVGELARLGYVGCWRSLRASEFGASHLRKRVFIVAYRGSERRQQVAGSPTWPTQQEHDRHKGYRTPEMVIAARSESGAGVSNLNDTAEYWATPHTNCTTGAGTQGRLGGENLQTMVDIWQTPGTDSFRCRGGDEMGLDQEARTWGTPRTSDHKGSGPMGSKSQEFMEGKGYLCAQVQSFQNSPPDPVTPDGPQSSESVQTSRRRLNPRFVEWLMGFPIGWTEL